MKVSIIGLGYVGLPLACAIAKKTKHNVVGFDLNSEKIEKIKNKICPIDDITCEEDLKTVDFEVSTNEDILINSDIFIICVPTPVLNDYTPDLNPVKSASCIVAKYLKKGNYLIIESTINPGVCDEIITPLVESLSKLKAGTDFDIAHCPERINPGDEYWNVYNIPRNIGSTSKEATKFLADFYREFISGIVNEMPDIKSTEATKIIENTFRDINIAFVNELARSFDVLGIDVKEVIDAASNKPFAFMPHYPGTGVGGHCIPVDPYYLIERARESGFDHRFLKLAREINNSMPHYTIELLINGLNEFQLPLKGTNIGLLGLSYKANVGDLRQSPSIELIKILENKGAKVNIYDPFFPDKSNCNSLEDLLYKSEAILIATNHKEFLNINPKLLKEYSIKVLIDGKNCLDKNQFSQSEVYYKGIGR